MQTEHLITMYIDIVHWPMVVFCSLGGDVTQCAGEDLGVCGLRSPVWLHCTLYLWIRWRSCGGSYHFDYWINSIFVYSQTILIHLCTRNSCVFLLLCFSVLVHPWSPPSSTMISSSLNAWAVIFTKYKSGFKSVDSYAIGKMGTHVGICINIYIYIYMNIYKSHQLPTNIHHG